MFKLLIINKGNQIIILKLIEIKLKKKIVKNKKKLKVIAILMGRVKNLLAVQLVLLFNLLMQASPIWVTISKLK